MIPVLDSLAIARIAPARTGTVYILAAVVTVWRPTGKMAG
ncbi:hypothetical protein ALO_03111 [Acetonema longum DSM 6540]|uniref:Uncharacterized protein n=1 Tax=Acetonema longum DSM 6540 TaxID=1009370 RepID=F7NF05_9FIRM|nr:hypothetical protein ALO_03111 [Acetonema longum DSM 6540]